MGIYKDIKRLIEQEFQEHDFQFDASNSIMVNTYNDLQTLSDKKEGVFYITKDTDDVYLYDPTSLSFINVGGMASGGLSTEEANLLYAAINHTHSQLHEHTNKSELDRLGISENNRLEIDGVEIETGGGTGGVQLNDATPSLTETYSSQNIEDKLSQKAAATHEHTEYLTQTEGDTLYAPAGSTGISQTDADLRYSQLNHNHNTVYSPLGHTHSEYASSTHNHSGVYEPVISTKGTAFNKNFGGNGTSTDVSRADHTHTDYTTVTAVNDIIADSVGFRDSNILLNGSVLETEVNGSKIGIEFNLLAEPVPATQDGTTTYPYIIQTIQDLQAIPTRGLNKHFKLWNSLDLSGITEWTPLGILTGSLDGNNKVISGLKIAAPTSTTGVGLFNDLQGGTIKNLIMSGATITTNKVNTGVVVGKKTSGTLENVFVVNSTITATNYNIGFISGNHLAGSILKSGVLNSTLTISTGSYNASLFTGDNRAKISECFAVGSIVNNNNAGYAGSFAGTLGSGSDIDDVYVVNTFSGTYPALTTGFTSSAAGTINNVYTKVNRAKMTFSSGGTLTLQNGFYNVTTLEASPTLQGQSVSDLSNQASFIGFDFTNLWVMDTSKGRPVLKNVEEDVQLETTPAPKPTFTEAQETLLNETYAPLVHSHSEYQTSTQVNTLIKSADKFLNVKDFGNDIQAALNEAKTTGLKTTVFVPNGTYSLSTALKLPSNITLLLDKKAIIKRATSTMNLLIINDSDGTVGSYDANENINIIGGIFDGSKGEFNTACTLLALGHAKNIVIKNAVFKNLYDWHFIELNGVRNCTISECFFENNGDLVSVGTEMIQLDLFKESTVFPWFGPYDNTTCRKITIENNYFKDGMIAIGSHSSTENVRHIDVKIKNNHFNNFFKETIQFRNWQDVFFENNYVENCYKGFVTGNDGTTSNENINVLYNVFTNIAKASDSRAIQMTSNATAKIKKARVIGNRVNGTGSHAVGADYADDIVFKDNNIQNAPGVGLWVYGINNAIIQNNTVKNTNTNAVAGRGDIVLGLTGTLEKNIICKDNLVGVLVVDGIRNSIVKDNIITSLTNVNNDATVIIDNNIIGG